MNIEVFGHKLLQSQVLDKPRKAVQDRRATARACLLDNIDIARPGAKREAKKVSKKTPSRGKRGKKAASPMPSLDSTKMKG